MAIQNFFTSRDNNLDGNTYVGSFGRLWYNPDTNSIYASDGVTVGGIPVDLATNANILANIITVNTVTSTTGNITVTGNLVISGDITPATETKIGGIKAGPGANVSNDGTLTIDTSGLPLSFGDFTANTNILTLVNQDQNMILATQGSAEVQLVGNIGFYKTNGFPPDTANRFFRANDDGQIQILVSNVDPTGGAVEIVGSSSGVVQSPVVSGTMLHITGQNDLVSRTYNDSIGNYSVWIGRRYNGTAENPMPVLANQSITRFGATTYTSGNTFTPLGVARFDFVALEDQTPTAQGAKVVLSMSDIGGNTAVTAATWTAADGMIGNVVGNVTGTATTATNLAAATGILAGTITINPASVAGSSSATQTFTLTGLTTNHKVVITSGTALNSGLIIQAAWASALNTISIEFYNVTNQPIDAGATTIQYFAWV